MHVTHSIPEGQSGFIGMSALTQDYVFCYPVEPNWHYQLLTFDESLRLQRVRPFRLTSTTRQAYTLTNAPAPVAEADDLYFILPTAVGDRFDGLVLLVAFGGNWTMPGTGDDPNTSLVGVVSLEIPYLLEGRKVVLRDPIWSDVVTREGANVEFFNRHTFYTVEFESVLRDLRDFLESSERELIVVDTGDFDHTLTTDRAVSDELLALITRYFGGYLIRNHLSNGTPITPARLASMTIGELTGDGDGQFRSRVIFFYNNAFRGDNPNFFGGTDRYYSSVAESSRQLLTRFSWLISPTEEQVKQDAGRVFTFRAPKYELRDLATQHNPKLPEFLRESSNFEADARINRINVDLVSALGRRGSRDRAHAEQCSGAERV